MRKLFTFSSILLLSMFSVLTLHGQFIGQRTLDIGGDDFFSTISPDGGMGLYMGGSIKQSGNYDAVFVHLTGLGATAYKYGSTGADMGTHLTNLFDGNVLITGSSNSYNVTSNNDIFLTKINPVTGSVIWSKTFGTDSTDIGIKAVNSIDSNILVTGVTGTNKTDILLLKIASSDGHLIYAKRIGSSLTNDMPFEVQALKDYIIPGLQVIAVMGYSDIGFFGSNEISITVLDTDGNMFMQMFYGGAGQDEGKAGILTTAGYIYVAGNTSGYGAGGEDFFVMKLYAGAGLPTIEWFKTYGGSGHDTLTSFQMSKDGFLLAGNTQSFGVGGDGMLMQIDTNGNVLWAKNEGSANNEVLKGVLSNPLTNEHFAIGYTNSYNGGFSYDGYFIITDSLGNSGICYGDPLITGQLHVVNDSIEFPSINFTSDSLFINVINTNITEVPLMPNFAEACPVVGIKKANVDSFQVYPNPFSDIITINTDFANSFNLSVYDISSRLVYQDEIGASVNDIDLSNLQSGIYTLVCRDSKTEKHLKVVKY
jgi:hypothetical protein